MLTFEIMADAQNFSDKFQGKKKASGNSLTPVQVTCWWL